MLVRHLTDVGLVLGQYLFEVPDLTLHALHLSESPYFLDLSLFAELCQCPHSLVGILDVSAQLLQFSVRVFLLQEG